MDSYRPHSPQYHILYILIQTCFQIHTDLTPIGGLIYPERERH